MRRTPFSCSRSSRKSAAVWAMRLLSAVEVAPLVRRERLRRRSARAAHRGALGSDDVGRLRAAVMLVLQPAARIALALERGGIALLLVGAVLLAALLPPAQHAPGVPRRPRANPSLHWRAPRPIRLVA